jgi:hypothetical protein
MIGPKLQGWQQPYVPAQEERAWLAREFEKPAGWHRDPHYPTRTCLGCGHSTSERWYVQCQGWGVEAWRTYGREPDADSAIYTECFRLSWAEVARLWAAEGIQQELALP